MSKVLWELPLVDKLLLLEAELDSDIIDEEAEFCLADLLLIGSIIDLL